MIIFIIRVVAILLLFAILVTGMAIIFHFDAHPANLLVLGIGFGISIFTLVCIPERA